MNAKSESLQTTEKNPQVDADQIDSGTGPLSRGQKEILAVLLVPAFMSLLMVSIINVTLPSVEESLHTTTSGLQWVVTGYALVFGVLLVPAGRAGDVLGRGMLFILGLAAFGLGSLLSGLASSILMLNLARVLMGIGSGMLNPQVTGMIQQYFRGEHRGRAFGAFGMVVGISVAVGPILGGGLIWLLGPDAGWRWAFLINVPIAVIGMLAAKRFLPESAWYPFKTPNQANAQTTPAKSSKIDFDPVGMILLVLATVLVMIAFMELSIFKWWSAAVLASGAILLWLWVRWERSYKAKGKAPMVDMHLFEIKSFANGAALISFFFLAYTSVWLLVAQYFQLGLGYSALVAGLIGLPSSILGAIAAPWAGRRIVRVGRVLVVWGILIVVIGMMLSLVLVLLHERIDISPWWMLISLGITGLGQGLVVSPNQALTLKDVPLEYAGSAGGILQTGQRIGTAVGIAIITSVAFSLVGTAGWDSAMAVGLALITVFLVITLMMGLVDLKRERLQRLQGQSKAQPATKHVVVDPA